MVAKKPVNIIKKSKIEFGIFCIFSVLCITDIAFQYLPNIIGVICAVILFIDVILLRINCKRLYGRKDAPIFVKYLYSPRKKRRII